MAQAAPVQAEVQRQTLSAADARRALENPVAIRRGAVQSVTLTIPLLSERNSYLVVRLPDAVVQDLMRQAREVPDAERPAFVRDWVMRNQQAVLEQFVRAGRTERRFRYDVIPVPTRMGEVTPRRVEPPPQAERREESPHRIIEVVHVWDADRAQRRPVPSGWLGAIPAGWRAPRENELPQEVRTRANVLRPPRGPGQVPIGDARIEEFNGRRYLYLSCYHTVPAPTHESITVLVPAEQPQRAQERPAQPPPRVITPDQPRERPVAGPQPREERRTLPPLPRQITGGTGSQRDKYIVVPAEGRERGRGTGASEVNIPFSFDIEGTGRTYFEVHFTLSQLSNGRQGATMGEVREVFRQAILRRAAESGRTVENTALRDAFRNFPAAWAQARRGVENADPDFAEYIRTH